MQDILLIHLLIQILLTIYTSTHVLFLCAENKDTIYNYIMWLFKGLYYRPNDGKKLKIRKKNIVLHDE